MVKLLLGDCLEVLKTLETNSVDTVVTDPPAGISFMSAKWDSDKGGSEQWIDWLSSVLTECRRVLKPGGALLCWAIPRTSHWTGMAIERAGFEVRDIVVHCFSQGFPKALSLGKEMDKQAGVEREVVGENPYTKGRKYGQGHHPGWERPWMQDENARAKFITSPATDEAKTWEGHYSSLKPAVEFWWLAYNPREGTYVENALRYGVAGLNIDECRIAHNEPCRPMKAQAGGNKMYAQAGRYEDTLELKPSGRFPSDLILQHSPGCVMVGTRKVKGGYTLGGGKTPIYGSGDNITYNASKTMDTGQRRGYTDKDGLETIEDWRCVEGCPIKLIGEQSGESKSVRSNRGELVDNRGDNYGRAHGKRIEGSNSMRGHSDTGTAARYFLNLPPDEPLIRYQAKPSKREKNEGLEGMEKKERQTQGRDIVKWIDRKDGKGKVPVNARIQPAANNHPTVKSLELMKYLVRLTKTPTGGIVLDPFMGSGTTGVACVAEGRGFIGIEMNEEYYEIAKARIEHEQSKPRQLELL